jgi:hypothetical protein
MPHPRWLAWTGIALGALAPIAGCLTSGENGDPGAAFSSGAGQSGAYGQAGAHGGGGYVGTSVAGHGATDAGAHDANDAGATEGGATDGNATDASMPDAGGRSVACTASATATFSFAWSLEDAAGTDSTCDGVGGRAVDLDVINLTTGAEALTTTPCMAKAAVTCAMPAGSYSVSMKLRDSTGAVLSEIFAPRLFLVEGQATAVASLPLQVGGAGATMGRGFALTWSIAKQATGAIQSCAQEGAATVRLFAGTTMFDLPCTDGKGRTTTIAPGSYPVTLNLLDAQMAKLSETQTMTLAIAAGQLVYLGDVPFFVN